jgi:hypothetical protein
MLDPCTFPITLHHMPRYLNFKHKKSTILQCFWVNCTQNVIGRVLKILFALLKGFENIFVHVNFVLLRTCLSMSQVVGDQKSTQISVKKYSDSTVAHGAKRKCNGLFSTV